jgi:hypothetical protein
MARQVFFSFHFRRDAWRVGQIRNAWVVDDKGSANTILDWADWEKIEKKGETAVKSWIDDQMKGASVIVVLIGEQTYARPWVKYEIKKAHADGKGLLGIYMNGMKDSDGNASGKGPDPFQNAGLPAGVKYETHSWVDESGRQNFAKWVESAAKTAGR